MRRSLKSDAVIPTGVPVIPSPLNPVASTSPLSDSSDASMIGNQSGVRASPVEGVKLIREIVRTSPLEEYCGAEVHPGESVTPDEGIEEFVREHVTTVYHPAGTCRMDSEGDGVVDNRLRVHCVDGLRVVDASIMPEIGGGNTNAPTIAIAERAASFIREG